MKLLSQRNQEKYTHTHVDIVKDFYTIIQKEMIKLINLYNNFLVSH